MSVTFEAAETGTVRIMLYDAVGRQVALPREVQATQGLNSTIIDLSGATRLVPGMYVCAIQGAGATITRPMIFVR